MDGSSDWQAVIRGIGVEWSSGVVDRLEEWKNVRWENGIPSRGLTRDEGVEIYRERGRGEMWIVERREMVGRDVEEE